MNLRQKEYFLFNKPVSRLEFEQFMENFKSTQRKTVDKNFQDFLDFQKTQIHKASQGYQNEGVTGDHIFRSQNCYECFDIQESRDMKFCERIYNGPNADCHDIDQFGMKIERIYEGGPIGDESQMSAFVMLCYQVVDVFYSQHTSQSKNCFGCFGVSHAKYCILNKQYTKDEYEVLVPKIIEHMRQTREWGEFFPIELSPFAYNETVANEYYPLTKEEILQKGYTYKEESNEIPNVEKIIPADKLPDSITDIPDDILNWAIECEESKKPFKIQKAELEFYRKQNLPIPHYHPDIRHQHRMKLRNPRKLFHRTCDKCQTPIETTFSPERPETVYCEGCYLGSAQ